MAAGGRKLPLMSPWGIGSDTTSYHRPYTTSTANIVNTTIQYISTYLSCFKYKTFLDQFMENVSISYLHIALDFGVGWKYCNSQQTFPHLLHLSHHVVSFTKPPPIEVWYALMCGVSYWVYSSWTICFRPMPNKIIIYQSLRICFG